MHSLNSSSSVSLSPASATAVSASPSLLDRAQRLVRRGRLAAAPLIVAAAVTETLAPTEAAAQMTVDYSSVTTYSNSGWLTGTSSDVKLFIDDAGASGVASGSTASLSGSRAMIDNTFWRFDDFQDKTVPLGDTTGMAIIWGGQLQGSPATEGDSFTVSVNFSVTYDFTKSNAFDQPSLNFELQSGYGSSAYTIDYDFIQTPRYDASDYTSDSQSPTLSDTSALAVGASMTETYAFTLSTTMMPSEGTDVSYWFVQLNLNWDNEYANHYSWDDNYSKLNGDTFLAVGTASVAYHSVSAVPEPADAATGFGVVALLALGARRRSHRRV